MMRMLLKLAALVAAAFLLCSCSASPDITGGLEMLTVNGVTVDITSGRENIAQLLGEDFAENDEFLEGVSHGYEPYLVLNDVTETADYTSETYLSGKIAVFEPSGMTILGGMSADMSLSEYEKAFDGMYVEATFGAVSGMTMLMIAQADGVLVNADSHVQNAADTPVYQYYVEKVKSGEIKEFVVMTHQFNNDKCYNCFFYVFKSKK